MLNCDFHLGSLALLSPTSKYVGASSANPEGVVGEVIPYAGYSWVRVKWKNTYHLLFGSLFVSSIWPLILVVSIKRMFNK